jgi:hypothetical protein
MAGIHIHTRIACEILHRFDFGEGFFSPASVEEFQSVEVQKREPLHKVGGVREHARERVGISIAQEGTFEGFGGCVNAGEAFDHPSGAGILGGGDVR